MALDGRSAFAILLACYPKRGLPGISDDLAPSTTAIDRAALTLKVDGVPVPLMILPLGRTQARTRQVVERTPWWSNTPLGAFLWPEAPPEEGPGWPLGDYHRAVLWAECRPIDESSQVELTVSSPGRVRHASWSPNRVRR
jgi:hypothetical protein